MLTIKAPLTELRIGNFKAFGEIQRIPIRPLTLIYGPNSSGKSSVIHSLALLHEAERTGSFRVDHPAISGLSIDLGGFEQYVHGRDPEKSVLLGATFAGLYFDLTIGQKTRSPKKRVEPEIGIKSCQLADMNGPLVTVGFATPWVIHPNKSYEQGIKQGLKELCDNRKPLFQEEKANLAEARRLLRLAKSSTPQFNSLIESELTAMAGRLRQTTVKERLHQDPKSHWSKLLPAGIRLSRGSHTLLSKPICSYLDNVAKLLNLIFIKGMESLCYLGPFRAYPPRHLPLPEVDPNWQAAGGYAWDLIPRDEKLRQAVNTWLSKDHFKTKYEIRILRYLSSDRIEELLRNGLNDHESQLTKGMRTEKQRNKLLKELINSVSREGAYEIRLFDRNTKTLVGHRDVGVGISQLLPVLVVAHSSEGKTIAVEQPELHLHPALQAELGDLFIEAAKGDRRNTVIIETHSEHLILRILRRIRETKEGELSEGAIAVKPSDVQVIYAKPTDKGTILYSIGISEDGEFLEKWPDGFFPERAEELF